MENHHYILNLKFSNLIIFTNLCKLRGKLYCYLLHLLNILRGDISEVIQLKIFKNWREIKSFMHI